MKKIDLHMHSTVSDGSDAPEALPELVRAAGIGLFSLTDHDSFQGCFALQKAAAETGLAFLSGVEFSCQDEQGDYHILGYGFDLSSEPVTRVVEAGHAFRMEKLLGRLERLKEEFGVSFPEEEKARLLAMDNPGKPHIGNLMVKYGYAATRDEAIFDYINRVHYPSRYVRPEDAIEAIVQSGGIPVLAHPSLGKGNQLITGDAMEKRLRRLTGMGLRGVEAYYSGFDDALREEMLAFAETFDLFVTAGSDYHGTNKRVRLGRTGLPEEGPLPPGLFAFLEAAQVIVPK